jgi:hypothetical protein
MQKKLGLLIALLFLSVQVFSTLHMAEHGFAEHKHNGHICDIYLHCEHAKYSTPGAAISLQPPQHVTFTIALPELTFARSEAHSASSPRAPPVFS